MVKSLPAAVQPDHGADQDDLYDSSLHIASIMPIAVPTEVLSPAMSVNSIDHAFTTTTHRVQSQHQQVEVPPEVTTSAVTPDPTDQALVLKAKAKMTLEDLPSEIQLQIMESIDSPRALLAHISASPHAMRLFNTYKFSILKRLIGANLSQQAIRTGCRIIHYIKTKYKADWKELRIIGKRHGNVESLNVNWLEELFRICLFHEPLVEDCMKMELLRDRTYLHTTYDDNDSDKFAVRHIQERLERPVYSGVPLRSRLYSGLFALELFLRVKRDNQYRQPMNRDEQHYFLNIFSYPRYLSGRIWVDPDLMVDISLASVFVDSVYKEAWKGAREGVPCHEIPSHERLRKLFVFCMSHLSLTGGEVTWDAHRDLEHDEDPDPCYNLIGFDLMHDIAHALLRCVVEPVPQPYTWQVGHCLPKDYNW